MTQSDLIHESIGIVLDALSSVNIGPAVAQKQLETAVTNLIAAAVAAEREACAKVAETTTLAFYDTKTCREIAAAIRSRGEVTK